MDGTTDQITHLITTFLAIGLGAMFMWVRSLRQRIEKLEDKIE